MSDSISKWISTGRFLDFDGHQISWKQAGSESNPCLVLIHGFPTSSWDWHLLWDDLARDFHVVTLDMLGFGLSDKPRDHDYRIAEQADICESLLAQLNISEYHILAHDYGDTVAQELLARFDSGESKQTLKSVCLLNGGIFPEAIQPLLIQKLLLSPIGALVGLLTSYKAFTANLRKICARPLPEDELKMFWQLMQHNGGRRVIHKVIHYMTERKENRDRWVGALQKSSVPMRLIVGLEDSISGAHMAARYRELIPDSDIVELPGVGHCPQVEAPNEVLAAAREFQVRVPDPRTPQE